MIARAKEIFFRFGSSERGAVLAEAIIVIPFISLFAVAILEFGNMFWQKHQIEAGLRDAARYLARCNRDTSFADACNVTKARAIAFYGTPSPGVGAALRVPGWGPDAADIVIDEGEVVRLDAAHAYLSSPLFGWLGIDAVTIEAYHEQRYMGW